LSVKGKKERKEEKRRSKVKEMAGFLLFFFLQNCARVVIGGVVTWGKFGPKDRVEAPVASGEAALTQKSARTLLTQ